MNQFSYCGSALLWCCALLQLGCSSGTAWNDEDVTGGAPEADIGVARQAATALGAFAFWSMPIDVCVTKTPVPGETWPATADFNQLRDDMFSLLEQTWGSAGAVRFRRLASCPPEPAVALRIKFWIGSGGSACGGGDCQVSVAAASFPLVGQPPVRQYRLFPALNRLILHEVGHSLGLEHEHIHAGAELCEPYKTIRDGCVSCKTKADLGQPCPRSDYYACLERYPVPDVPNVPISADDYQTINDRVYQYTGTGTEPQLTIYDPFSIVNYCAMANGRQENDSWPTPLDYLGVNMLYPVRFDTHTLGCKSGCFKTGTGVVSNDLGQMVSDWTALGAVNIVPAWRVGGVGLSGSVLNGSNLPSGAAPVSFSYSDFRGRGHSGSGTVTKSNAQFAAIVGACKPI